MHNVPAKFNAYAEIEAKLSDGQIIDCKTQLVADGLYSSWWEYPCEPQHGSVNYTEQEVDEDMAEVVYPDEFEFIDEDKQKYLEENPNYLKDVRIVEIIKILNTPDWEVDEDTINCEEY